MKSWVVIFSVLFLSGIALGKDWPLSDQALRELLNRSQRWSQLSQEKQSETRSELIYALHLAASLEAKKTFFNHINEFWDNKAPLKNKELLLKEAEQLALQSAKQAVAKWAEAKGPNGKPISANLIIMRLAGGNLATEKFHEWDKFLTSEGEINYKSWPLGGDPSIPEAERPKTDLVKFISENYPDNPETRKEKAKKLAENSSSYYGVTYSSFESSGTGFQGSHSSETSTRPCGTPSSYAPTLRPEFNGRQ